MAENKKEIIKQINESFETGSIEGFLAYCTEDFVWTIFGETIKKGKEEVRKWMSDMEGVEPPKIHSTETISEGDSLAAYGNLTMKNKDGQAEDYDYCDIYRFDNSKVAELKSYMVKTEK